MAQPQRIDQVYPAERRVDTTVSRVITLSGDKSLSSLSTVSFPSDDSTEDEVLV
jgi:hypothetical protein